MSQSSFTLVALFFIGGVIGLVFFSGLWLSLKWCITQNGRYLWHFVGFILRAGFVCSAFFLLMQGSWQRLTALVVGFLCVRIIVVRAARLNINYYSKAGSL
jgi:F1F0 ATPase subunit 2